MEENTTIHGRIRKDLRSSDEPICKGMTQKLINRSYSSAVGQTG